jgi:hypothetical protein
MYPEAINNYAFQHTNDEPVEFGDPMLSSGVD